MTRRIVYRLQEEPDGRWLLFRTLRTCECCPTEERPVLRSGSTVKAARYPNRRMVLDAYEGQRRADVRAGTRIGVDVRVEILPYP